jgi:hypothetical protein
LVLFRMMALSRWRMTMEFKYKTLAEFVKAEGEAEAFSCVKTGWKQKQYRKMQNSKNQMLLELAKKDPRFRDASMADLAQKLRTA